jgi:hypothetical protein
MQHHFAQDKRIRAFISKREYIGFGHYESSLSRAPEDGSRVNQALEFIAQLKTRYRKPIIGPYGWPKGAAYGRRARMAGADFVFIIPEKPLKLRAAVADCLEPILNAGVDTELLEAKEPKGETYGKPSSTE